MLSVTSQLKHANSTNTQKQLEARREVTIRGRLLLVEGYY